MKTLPKSKTIIIVISVIVVAILAIVIPISITKSNKNTAGTTYKVTLNKQGGSGGTSSVTVTIDENMPKATAPNKSGYVFGGYYNETDGLGTQYYTSQMKSARKWDIEKDTTLYAYWITNEGSSEQGNVYTVTLDRQNGTGGSSSVKAIYNQPMPTASMPTRLNYTFGGYYSEPNGKGTAYYASNMASLRSWDKQSNGKLYAYWISDYNAISMTKYNYNQYFNIERSCKTAGVGDAYGFPCTITYKVTLKQSYTLGMDTSVSFTFQEGNAITSVSFKWSNAGFGASATSSKVYISTASMKNTTATPMSVSGTLYVKK